MPSSPTALSALREAAGVPGANIVTRAAARAITFRGAAPAVEVATVKETAALLRSGLRLRGLVDGATTGGLHDRPAFDLASPEGRGGRVAPLCRVLPSVGASTHVATETRTEVADFIAYNGTLPEGTVGFTKAPDDELRPRLVGAWIPAAKGVLEDAALAEEAIATLLEDDVARVLDAGLLTGDGVGERLRGVLDASWGVTSTPLGTDTRTVALIRAATRIRNAGHTGVIVPVLNPSDAEELVFTAGFADAIEAAAAMGLNLASPVLTPLLPAGTAVLGVWDRAVHVYVRQGLTVTAAVDHSDDFLRGRVAIKAEARLVSRVLRPSALQIITGV